MTYSRWNGLLGLINRDRMVSKSHVLGALVTKAADHADLVTVNMRPSVKLANTRMPCKRDGGSTRNSDSTDSQLISVLGNTGQCWATRPTQAVLQLVDYMLYITH